MMFRALVPAHLPTIANLSLIASLLLLSAPSTFAQPERPSMVVPSGWQMPRTSDGVPDLQGVWTNATVTPLQRPDNLANKGFFANEEEARAFEIEMVQRNDADIRGATAAQDVGTAYNAFWYDRGNTVVPTLRTSLIIDPANGRLPPRSGTRPGGRGGFGGQPAGPEDRSLAERCIVWPNGGPPMVPSFYNNNYQIVQSPGYVAILIEMIHDVRIIPTDGRAHAPDNVRLWMGDPVGHWEGDTLVVETTNLTDTTAYQGTTQDMKLTERFTRVNDDILMYEFTVDDPSSYSQPWTAQIPMSPSEGAIYEYACNEGNLSMEGMLRGAREAEAEAAQQ